MVRLLKLVGIPAPETRIKSYPHELSGGMQQRVMIAMALAPQPRLLVADEPTTALDVTIQAQIIELLAQLRQQLGMAILLITHNLGIVGDIADEVAVMYAGQIVEHGPGARVIAAAIASLYPGADELRAEPGFRDRPARHHPGRRPAPGRVSLRLPVSSALSASPGLNVPKRPRRWSKWSPAVGFAARIGTRPPESRITDHPP